MNLQKNSLVNEQQPHSRSKYRTLITILPILIGGLAFALLFAHLPPPGSRPK